MGGTQMMSAKEMEVDHWFVNNKEKTGMFWPESFLGALDAERKAFPESTLLFERPYGSLIGTQNANMAWNLWVIMIMERTALAGLTNKLFPLWKNIHFWLKSNNS